MNICLSCGHTKQEHPPTHYVNGVMFTGVCLLCGCDDYEEKEKPSWK